MSEKDLLKRLDALESQVQYLVTVAVPVLMKLCSHVHEAPARDPMLPLEAPRRLRQVAKDEIAKALAWTGGNKCQAARLLGCNVKTVHNLLRRGRV